nr:uncharacterized protein LOC110562509 [Meriones unguiculatus]
MVLPNHTSAQPKAFPVIQPPPGAPRRREVEEDVGAGDRLAAQGARGGQGGCLFKRSRGAGARGRQARCHGTGAAGAAGPLGSLGSSRLQQSKAEQLVGYSARGWFGRPLPECPLLRVSPAGVELPRYPPHRETHVAVHESEPGTCNFCLASLTSARGSDSKLPSGARSAAGAVSPPAHSHGDDLPTVVLLLLRLGRRQLAARKRPTAPARHAKCLQRGAADGGRPVTPMHSSFRRHCQVLEARLLRPTVVCGL